MTTALLETKFYAPRQRDGLVPRPRLTERLGRRAQAKLTLVSAPAGFGKSTLVAEWLTDTPAARSSMAWLSLDPNDDHPAVFWIHLIAALQKVSPEVGVRALSLLGSPGSSIEAVLAALLNDLEALANDIVLVLDDYHTIDEREIQLGMAFMIEHLPPQVHVVITTRADPALPLARWRARGELVEVRAVDLRFTPDEAGAYLNGVMTLELTPDDVATLEGRTEGWVAALQLAGLSMQGRDDNAAFIAGFAGDDRYIVDYLVEEVWQRQPDRIRDFLLQTSILARMTGPLCDAVTGQIGGKATLEALDRQNLFLIPLDDRRRWYRYHHLFADVLQARLLDDQAELVAELHRRASHWYTQEGEPDEAVYHAFAGKDFAHAADLVELAIPTMGRDRRESTMRRWLEAIPEDLIRVRPVLSDGYAGALLVRGETTGVEARLADAERWLGLTAESLASHGCRPPAMFVSDEASFRSLPASIAIHHAGLARMRGDDAATVVHARRALDLVGEDDHLGRGGAAALSGLAYWAVGDLDAAQRSYVEAMASLERAGHLSDVVGLALGMADMQIAQGRLSDAMRTFERGLELATRGGPVLRGAADMHVGISGILYQRDDLAGATKHLQAGTGLGEENGLPQNPYRSRVAAALIRQTEGDPEGALELLAEADRLYANDFSPDVRPVAALLARVWIAQGKLAEALGWARAQGVSAADDVAYVREFEHITLARLIFAQGVIDRDDDSLEKAIALLDRLLVAAEVGQRTGSVIEILVVQALAQSARDDVPAALKSLDRAVRLAEPEGYVRVIADEGPTMAGLLRMALQQRDASSYLRRLLSATVTPAPAAACADQVLIEPLSERELHVLRLLATDLDGPDIAGELVVSLPTVRTHTQNIYAKLGVHSRRAAVRRAAELGLLTHDDGRRFTE